MPRTMVCALCGVEMIGSHHAVFNGCSNTDFCVPKAGQAPEHRPGPAPDAGGWQLGQVDPPADPPSGGWKLGQIDPGDGDNGAGCYDFDLDMP